MKKLLFFILIVFLSSCEKQAGEEKKRCWTCTEEVNGKPVRTWEGCDALELIYQDGRQWVTDSIISTNVWYRAVHVITCKQ